MSAAAIATADPLSVPLEINATLSPFRLSDDQLADAVIDGLRKLATYLPYIAELKARFTAGARDSGNRLKTPIKGCYSWTEFCEKHLPVGASRIRQLIGERSESESETAPDPNAKPTTCEYCAESFPSKGRYRKHFAKVHPDIANERGYSCSLCQAKFPTINDIRHHRETVHSPARSEPAQPNAEDIQTGDRGQNYDCDSDDRYHALLKSISERILARDGADSEYTKKPMEMLGWRTRNTVRVRINSSHLTRDERHSFWHELSALLWPAGWHGNTVFRENRRETWLFHWTKEWADGSQVPDGLGPETDMNPRPKEEVQDLEALFGTANKVSIRLRAPDQYAVELVLSAKQIVVLAQLMNGAETLKPESVEPDEPEPADVIEGIV